jgi:geranylgeranyl diphosphate synthase, type II
MILSDLRDSPVTSVVNISFATDAREFFASCRALIDSELDRLFPKDTAEPTRLHSAIRWSVFAGGKRFRPALLLATGQTLGAVDDLIRSACIVSCACRSW